MGITVSNKQISTAAIECGGSFSVTLSLSAEPDIVSNPTDIVLVLDRSGSMAGSPLANLKNGAKAFIDIIAESTGGTQSGNIGYGSRIGIVSFSDVATQDTQLITSVSALDSAVNALSAGGYTNHADAFTKAIGLFDPQSTSAKVIVMFTDGKTTTGPDAAPIAALAKAQGAVIYCIGLVESGGLDEDALNDWASDPDSAYVAITPDDEELESLFSDLAKNIVNPGATNITIEERINPCFKISGVSAPSKGTATVTGQSELTWQIDELGVTQSEGATLTFSVQHLGVCSGSIEVNEELTYSDDEGNVVSFPSPVITVDCGLIVLPEDCPTPIEVAIKGCSDSIEFDAGELEMQSLGRILQLSVTINNVCPNRRVALAAILTELDAQDDEHPRGTKTVLIPAHTSSQCRDVTVRCLKFVLPESLDVSGGSTSAICNQRRLRARFIAHYVDTDYQCCNLD
ncbi:MAG: VWA domain-containing protein [Eubacteriales bacterium]|nr:VWA domain-containing protein [Eubacteriales bacterium]